MTSRKEIEQLMIKYPSSRDVYGKCSHVTVIGKKLNGYKKKKLTCAIVGLKCHFQMCLSTKYFDDITYYHITQPSDVMPRMEFDEIIDRLNNCEIEDYNETISLVKARLR